MDNSAKSKQIEDIFRKYLESKAIVIVDPSQTARTAVAKIMQNLGAKASQLFLVNNYFDAKETIVQKKPHLVIAEYELGKHCGLELLQGMKEQHPLEFKQCLFILITGNNSQTAVARAAEEDIDAYIMKPFTQNAVISTILNTAINKLKPSSYQLKIDEGKKLLMDGKLDLAEEQFKAAIPLNSQPALAHYYLGQVHYLRKVLESAKDDYKAGLHFNRIHYKCMVGLYDLLMEQKHHQDAYEVVRRISQYFPANPKRLSEVLRLAIITKQYDDIEKYYAVFSNIDDRNENLIKYICAALVTCGKYYLNQKVAKARGIELFKKAVVSSAGKVNILNEIIYSLYDHNMPRDAEYFLTRFPPETQSSQDYFECSFLVHCLQDKPRCLDEGRALIQKHKAVDRVYAAMIKKTIESGMKEAANTLLEDAIAKYPDKKEYFQTVFKSSHPR